ncbi:MAG: hypothetical protein GTN80_04330 [Nitrososphaeria archaeon]|nr:hypothetical protein [Nitrososphaeria archaeon]NIN52367.1 hypothetical protein [Nitrososphaeria archaeon]NIQ32855.1 hypothetical protein [Nitrososphaeria archaeon]
MEFCLFLGDIIRDPNNVGHMSVECDAKILDDKDFKIKLDNQIGFLKMFNRSLDNARVSNRVAAFSNQIYEAGQLAG